MKAELSRSKNFKGSTHLTLENIGSLDFTSRRILKPAELLWISTAIRGKGLSKFLLQSFVEQIGRGQKVVTDEITHLDSWLALEKLGYLEKAYFSTKKLILSEKIY